MNETEDFTRIQGLVAAALIHIGHAKELLELAQDANVTCRSEGGARRDPRVDEDGHLSGLTKAADSLRVALEWVRQARELNNSRPSARIAPRLCQKLVIPAEVDG